MLSFSILFCCLYTHFHFFKQCLFSLSDSRFVELRVTYLWIDFDSAQAHLDRNMSFYWQKNGSSASLWILWLRKVSIWWLTLWRDNSKSVNLFSNVYGSVNVHIHQCGHACAELSWLSLDGGGCGVVVSQPMAQWYINWFLFPVMYLKYRHTYVFCLSQVKL